MGSEFYTPDTDELARDWTEFTGGPPVLAVLGEFEPGDVEALGMRGDAGRRAIISWYRDGETAELTSVHASPPGSGAGRELLSLVEQRLRGAGVRRLLVATTDDNTDALGFYQSLGFRLVRIEFDWMDRVRERKPGVPLTGNRGLPLRDLLVLEKAL